jgi:hypothetical protein
MLSSLCIIGLIMAESRGGGILGAFNTEIKEALKLLTTTFGSKMETGLKRKSVQMPTTYGSR